MKPRYCVSLLLAVLFALVHPSLSLASGEGLAPLSGVGEDDDRLTSLSPSAEVVADGIGNEDDEGEEESEEEAAAASTPLTHEDTEDHDGALGGWALSTGDEAKAESPASTADDAASDVATATTEPDLLFLDNVPAANVPRWVSDPAKERARVAMYKTNGAKDLKRAKKVGIALSKLIRSTARAADRKMRAFKEQLDQARLTKENKEEFDRIAAEAEAAAGSIVHLGEQASVKGLGPMDPETTWNIFAEINNEVNKQAKRQIFNAGVGYLSSYGHPRKRFPVALVPGFGGTRLQARLRSKKTPNACGLGPGKLRSVWLSSKRLFRFMTRKGNKNCLSDALSLFWNGSDFEARKKYVVKRVKGTIGVDLLDRGIASSLSEYFKPLIAALETIGYRREENLRALGYDWRFRPDQRRMVKAYQRWKRVIEAMYGRDNLPVVVVGHAMGAQHFATFLERIIAADPQAGTSWVNKYIKSYVSIGGTHAGAPRVIKNLLTGSRFSLPFFSKRASRKMFASFGSAAYMLPTLRTWGGKHLLVIRGRGGKLRGYSARRMERLLEVGLSRPAAFHYGKVARYLIEPAQLVRDAHFLYGHSVPTPISYVYEKTYNKDGSQRGLRLGATERGSGDGFVPVQSARALCDIWAHVSCRGFAKVNHRELLWHLPLLQQVLEVATGLRTARGGLVVPNADPVSNVDADKSKVDKPTLETSPDLGVPPDVDGDEPDYKDIPGANAGTSGLPLFGSTQ